MQLNVFSRMTYTIETLIQAGNKEMAVVSVPVRTNPPVRPSRLIRRTSNYVLVQGANILRITALYKPLPVFFGFAALLGLAGLALVGRYAWFVATAQNPAGHIQSLLLAAVLSSPPSSLPLRPARRPHLHQPRPPRGARGGEEKAEYRRGRRG